MRDNEIAYGSTQSADPEALSPQMRSFIQKNPNILRKCKHVQRTLNTFDGEDVTHGPIGEGKGDIWVEDIQKQKKVDVRGSVSCLDRPEADRRQDRSNSSHDDGQEINGDKTNNLTESYMNWLFDVCSPSLNPTFELGSLEFFRSPDHHVYMDELRQINDAVDKTPRDDIPVHSLRASMFLPKRSMLSFRKKNLRVTTASLQTSPSNNNNKQASATGGHEQWAKWSDMALDMTRQADEPALMSGNTAIDERTLVRYILLKGGIRLQRAVGMWGGEECDENGWRL